MSKEYDAITAHHYSSYRPALHSGILKRCLRGSSFDSGLDIGCGTGQSSIDLADFCSKVVGVDPSLAMISNGIIHPKVSYKLFDELNIDFGPTSFKIITLAGSLWYAKSQELLNEIVRVSADNSILLVYDFEILLGDILIQIGFESKVDSSNSYNHEEDFSGLDFDKKIKIEKGVEMVQMPIAVHDLAHLILSVKEQYVFFCKTYGKDKLFAKLVKKLSAITDAQHFDIEARTFSTLYHLN